MRIRTKLVVALAIPLAALIGISSFVVVLSARDADEAELRAEQIREQVALATASLGPAGIITMLQDERNAEAVALMGVNVAQKVGNSTGINLESGAQLRQRTDDAVKAFSAEIQTKPAAVREIYAPALKVLEKLPGVRSDIDAFTGTKSMGNPFVTGISERYTEIVESIFDGNSRVTLAVQDPILRQGAELIDITARNKEFGTSLTGQVLRLVVNKRTLAATADLIDTRTRQDDFNERIKAGGTGNYVEIVKLAEVPEILAYNELALRVTNGDMSGFSEMVGDAAFKAWNALTRLQTAIGDQLNADANALRTTAEAEAADARSRQQAIAGLAAVVVVLAAAVAVVASRSISRPMLRLAREADDMAANRLPGAVKAILDTPMGEDVVMPDIPKVPAGGGHEIAEVAAALNTVQDSAAELAVEQAVLRRNIADSFVNLGRRNQNLLTRQLDAITEMESKEADPELLQELFALDHLATRMRRNAESLLILAGLEPQRQWSQALPLIDVLRGALGEVEEYERVVIDHLDPATVDGSSAADLIHLVAELIENALHFSPPEREVEIVGRRSAADGYTLAIIDHGVGMSAEDLERANVRLAGGESFTVAPSRYLGHYVVGNHAARLGVTVRLTDSPTGGVTAQVEMAAVLTTEAAAEPVAVAAVAEPEPVITSGNGARAAVEVSAPGPVPEPESGVTANGYKRRVRGANVPRTEVLSTRRAEDRDSEQPRNDTSTAEGVRSLLSGLQAGTDRARAETRGPANEENR